MKRFLKTATLLVLSLFLLVSGVDATLDHLARSSMANSYTYYDQNGNVVIAYTGNLAYCPTYAKPGPIIAPTLLHRTRADASSSMSPISASSPVRWL